MAHVENAEVLAEVLEKIAPAVALVSQVPTKVPANIRAPVLDAQLPAPADQGNLWNSPFSEIFANKDKPHLAL
jgi:hypothetical protein